MGGGEDVELTGVLAHALSQTRVGEDLVEGVADVFEFLVEFVAVVREEVLQAGEQVARDRDTVAA